MMVWGEIILHHRMNLACLEGAINQVLVPIV